jgi:hypothetical protein
MSRIRLMSASTMAVAAMLASPAAATEYLFDSNGDSHIVSFDGFGGTPVATIPGLTSQLQLTLTGGVGTQALTFAYVLTNTSTVGGANSRVSGFAFSGDPNATGGSTSGEFANIRTNSGNYPNGIGDVEVCLTSSNACSGGGGGAAGAYLGDPATGSFTLTYGSNVSALTLQDFYVRYQGLTGLNGIGSATGGEVVTPPVPEPSTWAMMLFGFGALGFAMRRRRQQLPGQRVRFAF